MSQIAETNTISEEDGLRADLYDFVSMLLSRPPNQAMLERTVALQSDDDTELGKAFGALTRLAKVTTSETAEREFNALFIGLARGELLPYGSYYLTGFLNEKPLAALRNKMQRLGIARVDTVFEPEDNIASVFEMMAGLIRGRYVSPVDLDGQREFFSTHVGPWAGHFFSDLEAAKNSVFYAPVGTIGRVFMEIEKEAFRMAGETPA